MKPRIYADFNKWAKTEEGEYFLILECRGTFEDLERLGLKLHDGLEAVFYMDDGDSEGRSDDLEGDGVVRKRGDRYGWVAVIDESSIKSASERRP